MEGGARIDSKNGASKQRDLLGAEQNEASVSGRVFSGDFAHGKKSVFVNSTSRRS